MPAIGPVGLWSDRLDGHPVAAVRAAAAAADDLGYAALWLPEVSGREALTQAALLLAATRRIVIGTGIATIYGRDPVTMAQAERTLAEAYHDRFVLGLGVSHPWFVERVRGHRFGPRVATMRAYLDAMDAAPFGPSAAPKPPRRVLAALGPAMTRLAGERAWGAFPLGLPVAHTVRARGILGPDAFLAVGQPVVLEPDAARARAIARNYVEAALPNRADILRDLGHGPDLAAGVGQRLVDAVVAWGDTAAVARRVEEHLAAGADHVCLDVLTTDPAESPVPAWTELAAALALAGAP
jgi:probable F420-dependent oxidoreductase